MSYEITENQTSRFWHLTRRKPGGEAERLSIWQTERAARGAKQRAEREENEIIDRACVALGRGSAEALNTLHACRPSHPLGRENGWKWRNALGRLDQRTVAAPAYVMAFFRLRAQEEAAACPHTETGAA